MSIDSLLVVVVQFELCPSLECGGLAPLWTAVAARRSEHALFGGRAATEGRPYNSIAAVQYPISLNSQGNA